MGFPLQASPQRGAARWMVLIVKPTLTCLLASALIAPPAAATETARQILDRANALENTTRHWNDRYQRLILRAMDRHAGVRERELELYEKHESDGTQRSILFLRSPADVKDVAILAFEFDDKPTLQWLYTPQTRRVRQITASTRNDQFVGTDLTYRDLDVLSQISSWSESDAASRLRGEEAIEGTPCHVIELSPQRSDIGYRLIVVWLGRDDLVARQVELYEEGASSGWLDWLSGKPRPQENLPTRRVRQGDIRFVGAIPVPYRATIETPAAGSRTLVEVVEARFDQSLPERLFTQAALERGAH